MSIKAWVYFILFFLKANIQWAQEVPNVKFFIVSDTFVSGWEQVTCNTNSPVGYYMPDAPEAECSEFEYKVLDDDLEIYKFYLAPAHAQKFAAVSRKHVGKTLLITYDDAPMLCPVILNEVQTGVVDIAGCFSHRKYEKWNSGINGDHASALFDTAIIAEIGQIGEKFHQSIPSLFDKALVTGDVLLLNALLNADVTWVHSNGWVQNKTEVLGDLGSKVMYTNIQQMNMDVIYEDLDSVVAHRNIIVAGSYNEKRFKVTLKVEEIWYRNFTIWRLKARKVLKNETD